MAREDAARKAVRVAGYDALSRLPARKRYRCAGLYGGQSKVAALTDVNSIQYSGRKGRGEGARRRHNTRAPTDVSRVEHPHATIIVCSLVHALRYLHVMRVSPGGKRSSPVAPRARTAPPVCTSRHVRATSSIRRPSSTVHEAHGARRQPNDRSNQAAASLCRPIAFSEIHVKCPRRHRARGNG
jgi:hypothetical protein